MKKLLLSVLTICTLGSWPVIADAQISNGQNTATSTHISGAQNVDKVKPKVEAGMNGEHKVKPVSGAQAGKDNVIVKKVADAQRKQIKETQNSKQSSGPTGNSAGSSSGQSESGK